MESWEGVKPFYEDLAEFAQLSFVIILAPQITIRATATMNRWQIMTKLLYISLCCSGNLKAASTREARSKAQP